MRILHVITSLGVGGAEKLVTQIVPSLIREGHRVDLAIFNGKESVLYRQFRESCIRLKEKGFYSPHIYELGASYYNPLYIIKLHKIMKDYDVIHTHNSSPQLFVAIANCALHKKLVTTEHNTTNRKRNNMFLSCLDRFMYHFYDMIICISPQTQDNLLAYVKLDREKVKTIYNGIDIKSFSEAKPISIKEKNKCIITMVAAFRAQKDQDTVIKALKTLSDEYILWLIGDGERRARLKEFVASLHLESRVKFWGIRSDIANIMHASDIIIMSSHWEGFGLSAVEGMGCKKPLIASDVVGLKEIVENYGLLFKHGDPIDLASKIKTLHEHKDYYAKIADACYRRALQFDINKMVAGYEQVYASLLRKS